MSAASRFVIEAFSVFFLSPPLLQLPVSAKEKGSGDPTTPISLETDEAAARLLLLLLPFLSSLLLHSPPPPSVNDVFVPAVTNTTLCNFSRSTREGVGLF